MRGAPHKQSARMGRAHTGEELPLRLEAKLAFFGFLPIDCYQYLAGEFLRRNWPGSFAESNRESQQRDLAFPDGGAIFGSNSAQTPFDASGPPCLA